MAAKKKAKAPATSKAPTIHEATLASGPSGAVLKGPELDLAAAVVRRKNGEDVIVCGDDTDENRRQAQAIESAVGFWVRQDAHERAGPDALPHFQQKSRSPPGHSFYETARKKGRKQR